MVMTLVAINFSILMTLLPVLLSLASKRLGKAHLQIGTGLMFFLAQVCPAFSVWFFGELIGALKKPSSFDAIYFVIAVYVFMVVIVAVAGAKSGEDFGGRLGDGDEVDELEGYDREISIGRSGDGCDDDEDSDVRDPLTLEYNLL